MHNDRYFIFFLKCSTKKKINEITRYFGTRPGLGDSKPEEPCAYWQGSLQTVTGEQTLLLKRLQPYFFSPATNGKRDWLVLHMEISEKYFWVHKVETLIFLLKHCHDVDFWAQGMMWDHFSSTPLWPPWCGGIGHVPKGRLLPPGGSWLFSAWSCLPFLCKHLSSAGPSLSCRAFCSTQLEETEGALQEPP